MEINEKYEYIVDIIASYDNKVKLLNKQGFFDQTKWFETLTREICQIILNKAFKNLNDFSSTFPGSDLRSEDSELDIQVSTTDQINSKVHHTFDVIEKKQMKITKIVFVFLSNNCYTSTKKLPDYFDSTKHIFNIPKFLDLIKGNIGVINAIYELFVHFFESGSYIDRFHKLVESSEYHIKNEIESTIGNSLHIMRTIQTDIKDKRHVVVTGEAGFGKTVYAKMLIDEIPTIFACAEQFVCNSIDDIWGLDIIKAFSFLVNKKIMVIIDSLESLSDVHTNNQLQFFMHKISSLENVSVIFTCRTSELSKFTKLFSDNDVVQIELDLLNDEEMSQVYSCFPKLQTINETSSLYNVLRNPFYLNLLVIYGVDLGQISDANKFRKYVWDTIIAQTTESRNIFRQIVVDRAGGFSLFVPRDNYPKEVVDKLISDGILLERDNQIRAKFDIFEDICFERIIDNYFEQAQSDFSKFFGNIGKLGKCVFRRYQIWISNKLWEKINQEKFVAALVFSNGDEGWTNQTIIGILKSKNADDFIQNHIEKFRLLPVFNSFLRLMNLYGYSVELTSITSSMQLKASLNGRIGLLTALFKFEHYKNSDAFNDIHRFISSNFQIGFSTNKTMRNISFAIIDYISNVVLNKRIGDDEFSNEYVNSILDTLYKYSEDQSEKILTYFNSFLSLYDSKEKKDEYIARALIDNCLSYSSFGLAIYHPKLLCDLAFVYWTRADNNFNSLSRYGDEDIVGLKKYGLSKNADDYKLHNQVFSECLFFNTLLVRHFDVGIDFAIKLLNHCLSSLVTIKPDEVFNLRVHFGDNEEKDYLADDNLWFAYRGFVVMPKLLVIMLENIESIILKKIESLDNKEEKIAFANAFKKKIYEQSNNIALFPIILSIGQKYLSLLGDYAVDLASNTYFVLADIQRSVSESSQLFVIGNFSERQRKILRDHHYQEFRKTLLRDYVLQLQVMGFSEHCFKILDRHYQLLQDENRDSSALLQVELMDIRKAAVNKVDDGIAVYPGYSLSPSSEAIVSKNVNETKTQNEDSVLLKRIEDTMKNGSYNAHETIVELKKIIENSAKYQISFLFDNAVCKLFYEIIADYKTLSSDDLNFVFSYLVKHIMPNIDHQGLGVSLDSYERIFLIDISLLNESNLHDFEMLSFLPFVSDYNGLSAPIINSINRVFTDERKFTIIGCILEYSKALREYQIESYKKQMYDDSIPEPNIAMIINGLFSKNKSLPNIKHLDNMIYDIPSFLEIFHVDFGLSNEWSKQVISATLEYMVLSYSEKKTERPDFVTLDFSHFLSRKILQDETNRRWIISQLINIIPNEDISHGLIQFISDIFIDFTPYYYDAYKSREYRKRIEDTIDNFENLLIEKIGNKDSMLFANCFLMLFTDYIGDISNCPTEYSFDELEYLNKKYLRYGPINNEKALKNLFKLKISKLFPHLLPALDAIFVPEGIVGRTQKNSNLIIQIVKQCFYETLGSNKLNEIKNDISLSLSFESILRKLANMQVPEGAIILDEFLIY